MRLSLLVAAAISGLATASSSEPARVFLLRSGSDEPSSSSPDLSHQVTRLILQQRLSLDGLDGSINDLPASIDRESTMAHLNSFGKPLPSIFESDLVEPPSQLVVILEGVSSDEFELVEKSLGGAKPSFYIPNPPSALAHGKMLKEDFSSSGINANTCAFNRAINPLDKGCWKSQSSVIRLDTHKDTELLNSFRREASKLVKLASSGEMETIVLVFPESSRNSKIASWASTTPGLFRRQEEKILRIPEDTEKTASSLKGTHFPGTLERVTIPSCFQSLNSCITATDSCSGHGECRDRWATTSSPEKRDGETGPVCFSCRCMSTIEEGSHSKTHWAGPKCQKIDYSTPFALFVGFTIVLVGILSMSISLLFQVGEETLPSVLGAGVSRSK